MDLRILLSLLCFNNGLDWSHTSEVLPFDAFVIQEFSGNNSINISMQQCPHARPVPPVKIISQALTFPEELCQLQHHESNTTIQCATHGKCQTNITVSESNLNGGFTLSMLVQFKCKRQSVMQIFHWSNVAMYIHCNSTSPGHVSIRLNKSSYIHELYNSRGYFHLLLQVDERAKRRSYQVYINSTLLTERPSKLQKTLESKQIFVFGKDDHEGESNIGPFIGTVLAADLLPPDLSKEELDLEARYMENVAQDLAYPECTCQAPSSALSSGVLCTDGLSRLTVNYNDDDYIFMDKALSDGIIDTSLNYGFLFDNKAWYIDIKLHHPAQLDSMEIYTFRQGVEVYVRSNSSKTRLFWILSEDYERETSHWANVTGSSLSKLVWNNQLGTCPKVVSHLVMHLNGVAGKGNIPGNAVYEVILHGRPLDPIGLLKQCYCFPKNGQNTDECDQCGNCQCRSGGEGADRYCRPYLTCIEPAFGPESGGTTVTIHGGLLKLNLTSLNLGTSVTIGGETSCLNINHGDSSIICEVQKMVKSSSKRTKNVEVEIPVGGAIYKIRHSKELEFTYREDPVIKAIDPYKALYSGGIQLSITGENLDAVNFTHGDNGLILLMNNMKKHGNCEIQSNSVMVCSTPMVEEITDERVDIGFRMDGVTKYLNMTAAFPTLGTFTLHPDPKFYQKEVVISGEVVKLEGEAIDGCCNGKEYSVDIKGLACSVREVTADFITCIVPEFKSSMTGKFPIMVHWYNRKFKAGFYTFKTSSGNHGVIIGSIIGCAVLTGCLLCVFVLYKRGKITLRRNRQDDISELQPLEPRDQVDTVDNSLHILQSLDDGFKQIVQNCLIRGKVLQIGTQIGKGNFGKVFKGKLVDGTSETEVALKTLREGSSVTKGELTEFVEEATIMKDFTHPNVLTLVGIIIEKGMLYVALPFMANGDLRKYVARQMFNCVGFLKMVLDAAHGMMYLSKKKFVHRDLAARNCMVDDSGSVLIGDFGLARDIYQRDYYRPEDKQRPLPFKWMAPESLDKRIFTTKSDVWAMGILMWEVFTNGSMPYPAIENRELLLHLLHGYCLEKPVNCPETVYDIMKSCWQLDPLLRPSFEKITKLLTQVLVGLSSENTMGPSSSGASSQVTYYNEEAFPKMNKISGQKFHSYINEDQDANEDPRKGTPPTPAKRKSLGGMLGKGGGLSSQCLLDSSDTDSPVPGVIRSAEESLDEEGYLKPL